LEFKSFLDSLIAGPGNWIWGVVVAVLSFMVLRGALSIVRNRFRNAQDSHAAGPKKFGVELLEETLGKTSSLSILALACFIGFSFVDVSPFWERRLQHLWFVALCLQLVLYANRALLILIQRYFASHSGGSSGKADNARVTVAHTLIAWFLQAALWTVFFIAVLSNLGINVTTFVASLGIGGIAIGLAMQNILGDMFASLAIAVDKPFEVGDAINVSNFSGTVERVGLKTTRIRADSGEQVVISNGEMLKQSVRNFKRMKNRRIQFSLKISPQTSPELAAKVPQALKTIVEQQEKLRFDRAHLKTLDQNWLEYEVVYFVKEPGYAIFMECQQTIILAAMHTLRELGIALPAPTA
jgi:small-conductance mechanosensitive channel